MGFISMLIEPVTYHVLSHSLYKKQHLAN